MRHCGIEWGVRFMGGLPAGAKRLLAVLSVTLLTGCVHGAIPPTTERLGWVKAVIDGTAIAEPAEHRCAAMLSVQDRAAHRWVIVGVPHGRYRRLHTVMLPDHLAVQPGDRVRIDPTDCTVALRRDEDDGSSSH